MRYAMIAVLLIPVVLVAGCVSQGGSTDTGKTVDVKITASGFDPATVTINAGDTVKWTNEGSSPAWPASNPHPVHTDYPGFDASRSLSQGETYIFTFTKVGTWGYHNHLNPSMTGTVVVK